MAFYTKKSALKTQNLRIRSLIWTKTRLLQTRANKTQTIRLTIIDIPIIFEPRFSNHTIEEDVENE